MESKNEFCDLESISDNLKFSVENLAVENEAEKEAKKLLELILLHSHTISERNKNILKSYYGVGCDKKHVDKIAEENGLKRQRIYEIVNETIWRLKCYPGQYLKNKFYKE